jgi:hypothetical protein
MDQQIEASEHRYFPLVVFGGLLVLLASTALTDRTAPVWGVRIEALTAYVLLATLLVLWRYTIHTRRIADAASGEMAQMGDELRISHRPFVVTRRTGKFDYEARNIGPGLAVNAYIVEPAGDEAASAVPLGAFGPSASERGLHLGPGVKDHVLISEAPYTRTDQWTATLNVFRDNGQVAHRPVELTVPQTPCTLEEVLQRNWTDLNRELGEYRYEQFRLVTRHFQGESAGSWNEEVKDDDTPSA